MQISTPVYCQAFILDVHFVCCNLAW